MHFTIVGEIKIIPYVLLPPVGLDITILWNPGVSNHLGKSKVVGMIVLNWRREFRFGPNHREIGIFLY